MKEETKIIYVVTAYRWGNKENHSYVVGAFESANDAKAAAREEEECRGGKYECEVLATPLGRIDPRLLTEKATTREVKQEQND